MGGTGVVRMFLFALATVHAEPLPVVKVRALPAHPPVVLASGYTKTELISAMFRQSTVAYHPLVAIEGGAGAWAATPPAFTCTLVGQVLTVSYTREGFDTRALPDVGTCQTEERQMRFRIRVDRKSSDP